MSRTSEPHSIVAWVFVHELSGCGFEPSCSHLNFSFFNGFCSAVPQKGTNVDKFVCPMLSMQKGCLKLVSAIFIKFYFFFTKWQPFKNFEKCFLFHLKSSFRSRDIQFFVFLSFPLFLPVGHCFRGWSKINLKVHDVINCLNKNSITHFV